MRAALFRTDSVLQVKKAARDGAGLGERAKSRQFDEAGWILDKARPANGSQK